jgi:glycosyltransferase involved in cell wall biosynthesis
MWFKNMELLIDILICSYNEAAQLPALLDSLANQSVDPNDFRVIFVDNQSTDGTKEIVDQYRERLNLQYVLENRQGKSFALNTGYQLATTEYVAQIDADCKADSHWIKNILKVIEEEHPSLLGGPYYPYFGNNKPKWYKDIYNSCVQDNTRLTLPQGYVNGANMVWHRETVIGLGGHDLELGINHFNQVGGEDTELIARARTLIDDFRVIYDPEVIVYHYTKDKYYDLWYLTKRNFLTGTRFYKIFYKRESFQYFKIILLLKFNLVVFKIILLSLKNFIARDRNKYPFYENYIYEKLLPYIFIIGDYIGQFQS